MDQSEDTRLFAEDDSESMPDGETTLEAMIELVRQLVRGGREPEVLDIFEDIMLPAQHSGYNEQLELRRLCAVFSMVLEQVFMQYYSPEAK